MKKGGGGEAVLYLVSQLRADITQKSGSAGLPKRLFGEKWKALCKQFVSSLQRKIGFGFGCGLSGGRRHIFTLKTKNGVARGKAE